MKNKQDLNNIIEELHQSFLQLMDKGRKEFAIISYPSILKIYGVKNPDLKLILKELSVICKDFPATQKMELAKLLINEGYMETVQLAYEFIGLEKKALELFTEADFNDFTKGMDNWVCVDTFGVHVFGIAWRNQQISTNFIHQLAKHPNFWMRRLALVATIPLNMKSRGGKGDIDKTLAVCELLLNDRHDMVVKALSWSLRMLSSIGKNEVENFMVKHQVVLHARIKRELNNKLTTGKKN